MFPARYVCLWLLAVATIFPFQARGEEVKTFAVAPVEIQGPSQFIYLQKAIPSMLTSRLNWKGRLEPRAEAAAEVQAMDPIADPGQAGQVRSNLGIDYLVFGTAAIVGQSCDLNLHVLGEDGNMFTQTRQTDLDGLIPALEDMAKTVNDTLFKRPEEPAPAQETEKVLRVNPEFTYNETGGQEFYLNPQFRYESSPDSPGRWRSQTLSFAGIGLAVADLDGDGTNEVVIMQDNALHAYRWRPDGLQLLDTFQRSLREQFLNVNAMDLNRDGLAEIFVSSLMEESLRSFVCNFVDGKFKVVDDRLPYYLNMVRLPPTYMPTLIGQKREMRRIFSSGIHELVRIGGNYELGGGLRLPAEANVFNFAFLPQGDGTDYKVVVADKNDHLRVFTSGMAPQAVTSDVYAGSSIGLAEYSNIPGTQRSRRADIPPNMYYIPTRLIPADVDGDGRFELIVNKNMSVAAQFFQSYRNFPQGEIRSLYWDGIGLNIFWKTQVIRGAICDYVLADMNNDGADELCVLVRLHPGITGLKSDKTMVLTYTLDSKDKGPSALGE